MSLEYFFFGSPEICLGAIEKLRAAGFPPRLVVCQPDRPAGRGRAPKAPAVKLWAGESRIDVLQPCRCSEKDFLKEISARRPELGVVFAFGQLLPPALLDIPRLGFINVHPSLLPRWRGAAPVQWAIMAGDRLTGVSIVRVTPRLDDGEILLQRQVEIEPEEDAVQLGQRLAVVGGELAAQALEGLEAGTLSGRPQDEAGVTWARALEKSDGAIDWNRPAGELHNLVRGVQPWPGAFTRLGEKTLKIHRARLREGEFSARPGEVLEAAGENLVVAAARGALVLHEVQLEGRRRMAAREFLLGNPLRPGERLG